MPRGTVPKKRNKQPEHEIQKGFFTYIRARRVLSTNPAYHYCFAVPNGGRRSLRLGAYMVAEGLEKGVPDVWCPWPSGKHRGWICEVKHGKNQPTPEQAQWLDRMVEVGWYCVVCRSTNAMVASYEEYLKG